MSSIMQVMQSTVNPKVKSWFKEGRKAYSRLSPEEMLPQTPNNRKEAIEFLEKKFIESKPSESAVRERMLGADAYAAKEALPDATRTSINTPNNLLSFKSAFSPIGTVGTLDARAANVMAKAKQQWIRQERYGGFTQAMNPIKSTLKGRAV